MRAEANKFKGREEQGEDWIEWAGRSHGEIAESYYKVTGKQTDIGQEAGTGTRETKMDGFSLFLREEPNQALT